MSCDLNLNPDNSFIVKAKLTNPELDPTFVNDAVVEVTILDANRVEIIGESWPVALIYEPLSNGVYKKTFAPLDSIVAGSMYIIQITSIDGGGLQGFWENETKAKRRKG